MRRGSLIWGIIIILAGIILLLENLGLLPVNSWQLIWPLALILLGLWFLLGPRLWGRGSMETRSLAIPLDGARQLDLRVEHGAGRLQISALDAPGQLLAGTFSGGVEEQVSRSGDRTSVRLSPPPAAFSPGFWMGGTQGYNWQMGLSREAALLLVLKIGASENHIDLSGLRVTEVRIDTGASSTDLFLPQNSGLTRVEVNAGAASVNITIPQGVSARIHDKSGLSGIKVDGYRFPQVGQGLYQSADFDSAVNRADIYLETGVGSVNIR